MPLRYLYSKVAGLQLAPSRHGASEGRLAERCRILAQIGFIAQALFNHELTDAETERIVRANEVTGAEFEVSPAALLRQVLPMPASRAYRQTVTDLHDWAEGVIEDHRRAADPPEDLITTMLRAERDPDVELPPNQIRDEVLTFLFAGHETTALALTYALSFVSQQPAVADRVRAEAQEVLDAEQIVPTWPDLSAMPYTEQVVQEALRLRPPSWGIIRQARADSRLGETRIRRGDYLLLPQWTVHRDARYFDDPETFDPDRWADRTPSETPAYFPFGAGPHACIGGQLALTEARIVLAGVVNEFDLETDAGVLSDLRPAGVLQPEGDCSATVREVS